jgi:thymidylate kinase
MITQKRKAKKKNKGEKTFIVIIGPDGCGKTTVADLLGKNLGDDGYRVKRINFRFSILPPLSRLLGKKQRKTKVGEINIGMVKALPTWHVSALAVYYGVDFVLGQIFGRHRTGKEIIISARSYHDFFYQRSYMRVPRFIPKIFIKLGPKPDLIVTPKRSASLINSQKPELTIKEINDQYERIIDSFGHFDNFLVADGIAGAEQVVHQIQETINLNGR